MSKMVYDYEPGGPVRAFSTEVAAICFVEKWRHHQRRKPEPPEDIEDTAENDALHERWWARLQRWQSRCPGGLSAWSYSDLSVHPIKVWQ